MNKQQKLEIGSLINSLQVAEIAKIEGDDYWYWRGKEADHTIELYKIHGIELANLQIFLAEREA